VTTGVRFYSFVEASGYGLSGIAYARALVNAGVPVEWIPLRYHGNSAVPVRGSERANLPLLQLADGDANLADLAALLNVTSRPVPHDTVIFYCVPEHWPALVELGKRNIGCTVWETDQLPVHWLPILNSMHTVIVPSTMNRDIFVASGTRVPVHVVPHIRRHIWNEFSEHELVQARAQFGIPAHHFVFYTISTWQPRKAIPELLQAYAHAFSANDPVSLVLKTTPQGSGGAPFFHEVASADLAQDELDAIAAEVDHELPHLCLLPYELSGRGIDLLHRIGDCFVSLTHGEGWGLGAFEAATLGTPVVMTGWGGQCDFLGENWPGRIAYRLSAVPTWPSHRPSYWSSQRWASVDIASAITAMRDTYANVSAAVESAQDIQIKLLNRFAEPVVAAQILAAIHG